MINKELKNCYITRLKDKTPVLLRHIRPFDKKGLLAGFKRLSPDSRRMRFLQGIKTLSDNQPSYFTEVDNINHLAWCAADLNKGLGFGIGVGRYIRCGQIPGTAEFALTVVDDYQNRGLGTLLLNLLIQSAKSNNVSVLKGTMFSDNRFMIRIMKNLGAEFKWEGGPFISAELFLEDKVPVLALGS